MDDDEASEDWTDEDSDVGDNESGDTLPCPECGAAIYDDLDCCPKCNYWLTAADRRGDETGAFRDRNLRIVAVIALAAFLLAIFGEAFLF